MLDVLQRVAFGAIGVHGELVLEMELNQVTEQDPALRLIATLIQKLNTELEIVSTIHKVQEGLDALHNVEHGENGPLGVFV